VRILVADDDRVISTLICGVLAKAGHRPTPARDAMQALMFAMRSPAPELILLDVNMPGGTGVEALRKLKLSARTSGIPVIVVSGVDDPAMPQRMRELGALDVLAKPVDAERLLAAVDHAVGRAVA
jgi:CheY-like chemotaxis protein